MPFLRKRLNLIRENIDDKFQNENNIPGIDNRLPANMISLKPDCSSIDAAVTSNQPRDWLLHPTGYVFQFDAQKNQRKNEYAESKKVRSVKKEKNNS